MEAEELQNSVFVRRSYGSVYRFLRCQSFWWDQEKTAFTHKCLENLQLANRTVVRPGHPKYKQELSPVCVVYSESDVIIMNKVKFK